MSSVVKVREGNERVVKYRGREREVTYVMRMQGSNVESSEGKLKGSNVGCSEVEMKMKNISGMK